MNFVLDLLQGAGLGSATGLRPFLPAIAAGALARADVGIDFDGTAFAFLESPAFLLALVVALIASVLLERRSPGDSRLESALGGIGIGLGALLAAGSLDDRFEIWWPGLIVGGAAAALATVAARSLLTRVRARLDSEAGAALPVYLDGAALLTAVLCVLLPPLGLVAVGFLVWLVVGGRRRQGEKYAGLRILR